MFSLTWKEGITGQSSSPEQHPIPYWGESQLSSCPSGSSAIRHNTANGCSQHNNYPCATNNRPHNYPTRAMPYSGKVKLQNEVIVQIIEAIAPQKNKMQTTCFPVNVVSERRVINN